MATQNTEQKYDKPEGVGVQGQILQGTGFQVEFVIQNPPKGAGTSNSEVYSPDFTG